MEKKNVFLTKLAEGDEGNVKRKGEINRVN